jgi:hypothetical protein
MIDATTVTGFATAVYAVALLVLVAWLRRIPADRRALCTPVVFVVGVTAVTTGLVAAGVGTIAVGTGEVVVPSLVADLVAYCVLYAVMARLADVDGRALAVIVATPVAQRLGFEVATVTGGAVALLGLAVLVGGYVGLVAYLFGPIWRRAQSVSEPRRLLHWKARNLLLFMIGMLIAFVILALFGVFDEFVTVTIQQYMAVLIRVGLAGFLFANLDAVGTTSLWPSSSSVPDAPTAD